MKMQCKRVLLLAASVAFGGANVWGQDLVAHIPFNFRTTHAVMPAGTYRVSRPSNMNGAVLLLTNWKAQRRVFVLVQSGATEIDRLPPRMMFQCGEDGCALSQIWDASDTGYVFRTPPVRTEEGERIAVVYMDNKHSTP